MGLRRGAACRKRLAHVTGPLKLGPVCGIVCGVPDLTFVEMGSPPFVVFSKTWNQEPPSGLWCSWIQRGFGQIVVVQIVFLRSCQMEVW
jgi:hypothetical protein